ncbi:hypothetical protein Y1Q_0020950 [Alligator mississippiensis]|uniref:Uncharacterized protein n=1 Tax=Alligator mississippiensis TaxID=8496 RepID=A0A151NJI2_ALLMI|nr:hypothetical protein Y1Q_0020950 [Alligator mississippiensis]
MNSPACLQSCNPTDLNGVVQAMSWCWTLTPQSRLHCGRRRTACCKAGLEIWGTAVESTEREPNPARTMASVRSVPYGNSMNTETIVKIIGSKYIRCTVEKPMATGKESMEVETQAALKKLPPSNTRQIHGNPPGLSNSLCQQINYDFDYARQNKGKQEEDKSKHARTSSSRLLDGKVSKSSNIQCVSVPSGDQTLSYIHVLQKPFLRVQSLGQQVGEHQVVNQGPTESPEEDDSLLTVVRNEFGRGLFKLALLEEVQRELKAVDPTFSGFLPQSQLSCLLLKHEVPLQLPTVKLLFERFSKANDSELVNYDKLVQFLRLAAAIKMQNIETCAPGLQVKSLTAKDQSKSFLTSEDPVQTLKQAIKECKGELDIEKLSLSFQKEDKSSSGLLSFCKVEMICQKHGLALTPLLLEALFKKHELCTGGRVQWRKLVELLKEAQSDMTSNLPLPAGEIKEETCDGLATHPEKKKGHKIAASETWIKNDSSTEGKEKQVAQSFFGQTGSSDSEEQDTWIDRFRKLERALYLCDVKNTGMLEKEKAKRLIHNYNLIYDLALSPLKIDQALRNFRSGENMPLQPVLQYLKEL